LKESDRPSDLSAAPVRLPARQLQSKLNASGAVKRRGVDLVEFRPKNVDTTGMMPTKGKHQSGQFCRLNHDGNFFVSIAFSRQARIEGFL
jgi:hypothetical protein